MLNFERRRFPRASIALLTIILVSAVATAIPSDVKAAGPVFIPTGTGPACAIAATGRPAPATEAQAAGAREATAASEPRGVDAAADDPAVEAEASRERITDRRKGESAGRFMAMLPVRVVLAPLWLVDRALYLTIRTVEEKNLILRSQLYQQRLAEIGILPRIGGAGDGAGFGGGIGWRIIDEPIRPVLLAAASVNNYHDYGLDIDGSPLFGNGTQLRIGVRYRSSPEEDFFGLGPETLNDDRTAYKLEETLVSVRIDQPVTGFLTLDLDGSLSNSNIFPGEDDRFPSAEEAFTPLEVPGLDGGARLLAGRLGVALDFRDYPLDATSGVYLRSEIGVSQDIDDRGFDAWGWAVDAQGFLPVLGRGSRFGPRSHIAARLRAESNNGRGSGNTVPFFRMPTIGGSSTLRGFREYRFRDRSAVVWNFEYRWRIQSILQAVAFWDEGQVFGDVEDFDLSHFRSSFGGGLRIAFAHQVIARLEVGHGSEGTRTFFKFERMF